MNDELSQMTAMVVEDEPHVREALAAILGSLGCELVAKCGNGDEAVELWRRHRPQITLLDINLPGKRGTEVLQEIRGLDPEAFVVMLTSMSSLGIIQECLSAGAANYLRKDTPLDEIAREIRQSWKTHLEELGGKR